MKGATGLHWWASGCKSSSSGTLLLQGKEPSYSNMMALLRCTPPWNAPYTGSSSGASSESRPVVRTGAGRLAAGRRQRRMWSAEEEQALAFAATPRVLAALRRCARVVGNVPG